MRKAQDLLELARQKYPEQQDDVHGICLSDNGKLVLVLSTQTGHQAFHFEDTDVGGFKSSPTVKVVDIA